MCFNYRTVSRAEWSANNRWPVGHRVRVALFFLLSPAEHVFPFDVGVHITKLKRSRPFSTFESIRSASTLWTAAGSVSLSAVELVRR